MITILKTDLKLPKHQADFLQLLNVYATDIMGGGAAIGNHLHQQLIEGLQNTPHKLILLVYDDENPIAIANCFYGFSTFKAKPLLNIHDFAVAPEARGKGVAKLLLERIAEEAKTAGCCKITLEVLEGNKRAQKVYFDFGFENYELDPIAGKALFLEKLI